MRPYAACAICGLHRITAKHNYNILERAEPRRFRFLTTVTFMRTRGAKPPHHHHFGHCATRKALCTLLTPTCKRYQVMSVRALNDQRGVSKDKSSDKPQRTCEDVFCMSSILYDINSEAQFSRCAAFRVSCNARL
jgi:hypothetical protein